MWLQNVVTRRALRIRGLELEMANAALVCGGIAHRVLESHAHLVDEIRVV